MQLRAGATSLDPTSIRIDLAPYQHVHWLNDLEKVLHLSRLVRSGFILLSPGALVGQSLQT